MTYLLVIAEDANTSRDALVTYIFGTLAQVARQGKEDLSGREDASLHLTLAEYDAITPGEPSKRLVRDVTADVETLRFVLKKVVAAEKKAAADQQAEELGSPRLSESISGE